MPPSLTELEQQRWHLGTQLARLGDRRPGSVTGIVRRCGKATGHCAQPDDPGHGPTWRLTYKVQGKTISEALPTPAAVRKAEHEIAEFRKYQELSRAFVEINEKSAAPARGRTHSRRRKKNGGGHPARSRAGSRSTVARDLP